MLSDKYKVRRVNDEDISPEETLVDAMSSHASIEIPIGKGVFSIFIIGATLIFLFFAGKAFSLQITNGTKYAGIVKQSLAAQYTIPSVRGIIYDSKGIPLVENVPVYDIIITRGDFVKNSSAFPASIQTLATSLGQSASDMQAIVDKNASNGIFVLEHDISKDQAVNITAARLPGVYVVPYAKRNYVLGTAGAHLVGYTSAISPEEFKTDTYEHPSERVGRAGLEASYDTYLRGEYQTVILGKNLEVQQLTPVAPGDSIVTTVDSDVQDHLYEIMGTIFGQSGVARGAAIVQNVKTGAILGLVSMPSFDSNLFEGAQDKQAAAKIQNILTNRARPLFNRALSGLYSPGSTIKPLLAIAGLQEKIVTPSTLVYAGGSIQIPSEVDPSVTYTYHDWKVHGWTDIRKAIAWSVDVYFYALGGGYQDIRGLGIDTISRYLSMFHADQPTGVDLPGEATGVIPSKQWKKETKGEAWYVGDTYNVSIGQGDLSVTPLWLATYVSTIANGGSLMKPYVVQEIKDSTGKILKEQSPTTITKLSLNASALSVVREGMRQTITDGTAEMLQDLPVAVAAKTGTAQINKGLNSLFIVYGPYGNPDISMTILVENITDSQSLAVRIAHDFLLWYFGTPAGRAIATPSPQP